MKVVHLLVYIMAFVFLVGETARRGIDYFTVNATTMLEDYFCGALLLLAAGLSFKKHPMAPNFMLVAWAYATGGMFVPFFAHLEAWLRGATIRPDHPHEDVGSIVTKGIIWATCLTCLIITLRNGARARQPE